VNLCHNADVITIDTWRNSIGSFVHHTMKVEASGTRMTPSVSPTLGWYDNTFAGEQISNGYIISRLLGVDSECKITFQREHSHLKFLPTTKSGIVRAAKSYRKLRGHSRLREVPQARPNPLRLWVTKLESCPIARKLINSIWQSQSRLFPESLNTCRIMFFVQQWSSSC